MVSDHYGHSHMQDASSFVFYGHMRHLLSAMSVRLWIVMYIETEIGTPQTQQRLFFSLCLINSSSFTFENNSVRPRSSEQPSNFVLSIEKFRCKILNLNLPTIKNGYFQLFVSSRSVTHLETDLGTVLESLGHTGHVGMLG